jgi:hypothetical protein
MDCVADMEVLKEQNDMSRERGKRSSSLIPLKVNLLIAQMKEAAQKKTAQIDVPGSKWRLVNFAFCSPSRTLSREKATELDMDHIYLKFSDFLWAYTFIGPFSYILWKRRKWLQTHGLINPQSMCDYGALAATLCLEQTQAINFFAKAKESSNLGNIAGKSSILLMLSPHVLTHSVQSFDETLHSGFLFTDFGYVDNNCEFQVADLFSVVIDLDTKRFVKATLDDEVLNAKEATILLWYNTSEYSHTRTRSHFLTRCFLKITHLSMLKHHCTQNSLCPACKASCNGKLGFQSQ